MMPGENTVVFAPGSAISAVTTGAHTPHTARSILVRVTAHLGITGLEANMPLLSHRRGLYIPHMVAVTASRREESLAHSPRSPPVSDGTDSVSAPPQTWHRTPARRGPGRGSTWRRLVEGRPVRSGR